MKKHYLLADEFRQHAWTDYLKEAKSETQQTEQEDAREKVKHNINVVANKVIQFVTKIVNDEGEKHTTRFVRVTKSLISEIETLIYSNSQVHMPKDPCA